MEVAHAKELLAAERLRVESLLRDVTRAGQDARDSVQEGGDWDDPATSFISEEGDDAVAAELRSRLDAIGRAEDRLAAGTFGRSVRSGAVIPDARLEADPSAELTVAEEAQEPPTRQL